MYPDLPSTQNEWAILTGAAHGLGHELAKRFAEVGIHLVLVDKDPDTLAAGALQLKSAYGIETYCIGKDLIPHESVDEIFADLATKHIQPSFLVNNAGIGVAGPFSTTDLARECAMIHLNVIALVKMTKRFLAQRDPSKTARILNVASTAAFQPVPELGVYAATKSFVLSFSGSLAQECRPEKVTVTALCPGPMNTSFIATTQLESSPFFSAFNLMSPSRVSHYAFRALRSGKSIAVPGFRNKVMLFLVTVMPAKFVIPLVGWLVRRR